MLYADKGYFINMVDEALMPNQANTELLNLLRSKLMSPVQTGGIFFI